MMKLRPAWLLLIGFLVSWSVVRADDEYNPDNPPEPSVSYKVTATASPSAGGSVTGAGSFTSGQTTTMKATPGSNYNFSHWTLNGAHYSDNKSFTYTVTGDAAFVAYFQPKVYYTVSVAASDIQGATVSGGGSYEQGKSVTIKATLKNDYTFQHWTLNGKVYTTAQTFSYTVGDSAAAFVAVVEAPPYNPDSPDEPMVQYHLTLQADPAGSATLTGAGNYLAGTSVNIQATAKSGYRFVEWTRGGTTYSTVNHFNYTVGTTSETFVAHMAKQRKVTTSVSPSGVATVTGAGTYDVGQTITLTTTCTNTDYTFQHWTLNGHVYSSSTSVEYTLGDSAALFIAVYQMEEPPYNPDSPDEPMAATTIYADPPEGYYFVYWEPDHSTKNPRTVWASEASSYTPVYAPIDFAVEIKDTICSNEYYQLGSRHLTASGVYKDTLLSSLSTDSVVTLQLTVLQASIVDTIADITDQQLPFSWHGQSCSASGMYYDSLQTVAGCDSVIRLHLTVQSTSTCPITNEIQMVAAICSGEVYTWHTWRTVDRTYTAAGNYLDTLRTKDGLCDSIIYTLSLTVRPTYDISLPPATICANEWYNFCGTQLNIAGDYDTTLMATNGCDSIVRVHLSVYPTYEKDTTLILCSGSSVTFNGRIYTSGGNYQDTLTTDYGCDSIYKIRINEVHPFYHTEHVELCEDSTMEWHGQHITGAGIYYDSLKSNQSYHLCDSVYELIVTQWLPSYTVVSATILSTESYNFGGRLLTEAGVFYDTLHAHSNACDSIVELRLTVLPVYTETVQDTICRGEVYIFNGTPLENSGVYTETFMSSYGTDSVVTLSLVVLEPRIETTTVHISDKETYVWTKHDLSTETLNQTGVYDDSLHSNVTGCDSINRLYLYVHPTYEFNEVGEICAGESYIWRGHQLTAAGDYYANLQTQTWNYDSIYHLALTVHPVYLHDTTVAICAGEYYDFHGTLLDASGTYYDTIPTIHGCDSITRLTLDVSTDPTKQYSITVTCDPTQGRVLGTCTAVCGEKIIIYAEPTSCYTFVRWSDGSTSWYREVTVTGDATYTAIFEVKRYRITGRLEDGSAATITITPAP